MQASFYPFRLLGEFFFPAKLRWILRPALIVLGLYALCRLVFVLRYPHLVENLTGNDWLHFAALSLRYDLSTLASLNLLWVVLVLLPLPNRDWISTSIRLLFSGVNGLFLIFNLVDLAFFAFNTRRLTWPQLRFLQQDALAQIPQFLGNYWYIVLPCLLVPFGIWRSFSRFPGFQSTWKASLAGLFFWLALGILGIRNSLGLKPLLPGEAFTLSQNEAGHAILNTPFLLFKTYEAQELTPANWVPEEAVRAYSGHVPEPRGSFKGYNLVLLILESFSTEYTGLEGHTPSYTPFLDSLAREGWYFPHHFASGSTSRDALPSILSSIPPWMEESFSSSPYVSIRQEGLGKSLSRAGYWTGFFHGGKNGTMSFDLYSRIAGFQHYFGLNEYPNRTDYDGNWGIFDGPYLRYVARKLNEQKPPFAAAVFTLSSHQPYTLPPNFQGKFREGALPILPAVGYSDFALRQFFAEASRMPWYSQTVFVVTADHTHERLYPDKEPFRGRFDVPLLVFVPGRKGSFRPDTTLPVQHVDIAPGIRDLLGLRAGLTNPLGKGWQEFRPSVCPMVWIDGYYQMIHPQGILQWEGRNAGSGWHWLPDKNGTPEPGGLRVQAMTRLQIYRNGLRRNALFK